MSESLRRIAFGLGLIRYSLLLLVFTILVTPFVSGLTFATSGKPGLMKLVLAVGLPASALILSTAIGIMGKFFCLNAPNEMGGARKLITVSLALDMACSVLNGLFATSFFGVEIMPPKMYVAVNCAEIAFRIASLGLVLWFVRKVAHHIGDSHLATSAKRILWSAFVALGGIGVCTAVVLAATSWRAFGGYADRAEIEFAALLSGLGGVALFASVLIMAAKRYLYLLSDLARGLESYATDVEYDSAGDAGRPEDEEQGF